MWEAAELTDYAPPYSEMAESAVLSCCMKEPELVDEAATSLAPEDFYALKNLNLFSLMLSIREAGGQIDVITIRDAANSTYPGGVEDVGGLPYLAGLPDLTPSTVALPTYVAAIAKKAKLRRMMTAAREIISATQNRELGDDEKLEQGEQTLVDLLQQEKSGGEVNLKDAVKQTVGEIERAFANKGSCTGIASGFPARDRLTTGFHDGDVFILAARPSMGKTSLAMSIAEHVAMNDSVPVGIFSMEMTATSLLKRMMSSRANVDGHSLLTGNLSEQEIRNLTMAAGRIAKSPMVVDETAHLTVAGLASRARRMVARHGVKLIVVDYLQLMHAKADSRVQEVTKISNGLKAVAKQLNIPMLVLSQLSRSVEQQDRPPRLSDLRDSGSIEQDADVVAMLHRPDPTSSLVDVMVLKHRNGPTGVVELEFDKTRTKFKVPIYVDDANVDSK